MRRFEFYRLQYYDEWRELVGGGGHIIDWEARHRAFIFFFSHRLWEAVGSPGEQLVFLFYSFSFASSALFCFPARSLDGMERNGREWVLEK